MQVTSHKVQSVKSCENAGESAETVGGESVATVGVGGKDRIVIKKVGYAKRCRGLSCVRIVSPQIEPRGSAFTFLSSVAASRSAVMRRVGSARCRSARRGPERLGGLSV